MAKSKTNLDNFLGQVREQYIPRSDKFEVQFTFPDIFERYPNDQIRQLTVMCEEAQLPGLSATNVPIKIGPWTEFRNQNVEFLTQDSVFTFVSDGAFDIRTMFEYWIQASVDPVTKEAQYQQDIAGTIDIAVLDNQNNVRTEYQLQDAIPKLINVTPLAWSNTGHIRVSVSFAAKKWVKLEGSVERRPQDQIRNNLRNTIFTNRPGGILSRLLRL